MTITFNRPVTSGDTTPLPFILAGTIGPSSKATDGWNSFALSDAQAWSMSDDGTPQTLATCSYDGLTAAWLDDLGRPVPAWTDFPITLA